MPSSVADDEKQDDVETEEADNNNSNHMAGLFRSPSASEVIEPDPATSFSGEFSLLVVLLPDGVRHRVLVSPEYTVAMLTDAICLDLRLNPDLISYPDLNPAPGLLLTETTLGALGYDGVDPDAHTVYVNVARRVSNSDYVMPDRIQVQVFDENTQAYRSIAVDIEKFTGHKPYLGGFRHRKTQQIFHHASSQTVLTRARRSYGPRSHRNTQTQELTTRSVQTTRESGTQMERRDLRMDNGRDRTVTAKPYFDSYQFHCLKEDSVLLIQRLWRGYKARSYVHNLCVEKQRMATQHRLDAEHMSFSDVEHQKREVQRRMHPKTVSDFEVLYNELDKWRQIETRKLNEDRTLDDLARQDALEAILAKETKLLQTIDRLKLTATDANRKQRIESMLQFMARPKQWQMSDGGVREVHTPFTIRAKELADLYHGLKMSLISVDERLDVLLHAKWTVKEFECPLTREIIELIDREADMLNRGRKEKSLEGLRKRLNNLFLQFIETPEFNPEAVVLKQTQGTNTV
ncbi:hypothetical protein Poli38472_001060 [Pythium oligandrum]|uniref:IQ motif and ubiquitin-like domain-containing protein n=1 Tax=Pythium oligandrum TaxID=41045 RepID=A0A8K1CST2_PYTOL|nr:hypothetical protein Poli38472_001060 [Pythium oligandrum]|eukprot:TMW68904.1 hypothetical protein Poli38472_001060 [Pythium oligandrum]